jgi:hypothetical protein
MWLDRRIGLCFAALFAVVGCDGARTSAGVGTGSPSATSASAPKVSAASLEPVLAASAAPVGAKGGAICGKTPAAGPGCETGLECFEKELGADVGICAEPFDGERMSEEGEALKGRWIGVRNRRVTIDTYHCASIKCSGERCIPCSALLILEDRHEKVFLVHHGAQLLCKGKKGLSLPLEISHCDLQRGEYAVIAGRLVDAGFRWAKLDLAVKLKTR